MALEPATFGAISGTAGLFTNFLQHFRPARAPYLLVGVTCVACLLTLSATAISFHSFSLLLVPVGGILTVFSILCFYFRPYHYMPSEDLAELKSEIDDQFKFSRTLCLTVGVIGLSYLMYYGVAKDANGYRTQLFWISYTFCIIYISTFVIYIIFRNNHEELNLSVIQITFFTVAMFVGFIIAATRTFEFDSLLYACERGLQYEINDEIEYKIISQSCALKDPDQVLARAKSNLEATQLEAKSIQQITRDVVDKNKFLFWYFVVMWASFQLFWVIRLLRTVKLKIAVEVTD